MRNQTPPLNTLRAFDAAARHLSFKAAARELFVTPGAISQQIKRLEETLGVTLFHRLTRHIALTDAGHTYYPAIHKALGDIAVATENLTANGHTQVLNVSVFPSLAIRWLVPRLGRFSIRHPDIEVRLNASRQPVDFASENTDMAIRHGRGNYPGLRADLLAPWILLPVCSRSLFNGPMPLRQPSDLAQHTLLHDEDRSNWIDWLALAEVEGVDATRGPIFNDTGLVMGAASESQGVALGSSLLIADEVATGNLTIPFGPALKRDMAVHIVSPKAYARTPKVTAFRNWLLEEVAVTTDILPQAECSKTHSSPSQ